MSSRRSHAHTASATITTALNDMPTTCPRLSLRLENLGPTIGATVQATPSTPAPMARARVPVRTSCCRR